MTSIAVASLLFLFMGLAVGRAIGGKSLRNDLTRLTGDLNSQEVALRQLARSAEKLRAERQVFNNFMLQMSEFAREINTRLDRTRLANLLLQNVEQMFGARQILIFLSSEDGTMLELEAARGFPDPSTHPVSIRMNEGRIGWAASHQVTMSREDFTSRGIGARPPDDELPRFRPELIAPMVHGQTTVGAVCVSGVEVRLVEQKKMLKMAADLGSAALQNSRQFMEISSSANHDGLTKLFNRRHFMEQLGLRINEAERDHTPLSIFLFDIDHFKSYNDNNGHLAGDEVLRTTGRILRERLTDGFISGRYGGEEFIIAMPRTPKEEAHLVADRLRTLIQQFVFPNEETQPGGDVTISGGVATFPGDGRNIPELVANADKALYRAKSAGRNRVESSQLATLGHQELSFGNR